MAAERRPFAFRLNRVHIVKAKAYDGAKSIGDSMQRGDERSGRVRGYASFGPDSDRLHRRRRYSRQFSRGLSHSNERARFGRSGISKGTLFQPCAFSWMNAFPAVYENSFLSMMYEPWQKWAGHPFETALCSRRLSESFWRLSLLIGTYRVSRTFQSSRSSSLYSLRREISSNSCYRWFRKQALSVGRSSFCWATPRPASGLDLARPRNNLDLMSQCVRGEHTQCHSQCASQARDHAKARSNRESLRPECEFPHFRCGRILCT